MIQMIELVDEYMKTVLITLFYIFKGIQERLSVLCGDINDFTIQIRTFVFIQGRVTEAGFSLPLKKIKKWWKCMKQQFSRHWARGNKGQIENKEAESYVFLSLLQSGVSGYGTRRKNPDTDGQTS